MGDSIVYASYATVETDSASSLEATWAFRASMPARREGAIAVSTCKPESHSMHSRHMGVLLRTSGWSRGSVQVPMLDKAGQYFKLVSGVCFVPTGTHTLL